MSIVLLDLNNKTCVNGDKDFKENKDPVTHTTLSDDLGYQLR